MSMPVQLTPRGTRGAGFPKMAPWLLAVFHFLNVGMFRLFGRRMRIQGAWTRIVALAPGYGKYAEQTDCEIPVVRLTQRR
jgi:hypothetical protein